MPILDNSFVCTNGHKFNANAKVRARCPECGTLTRRDFTADPPDIKPKKAAKPTAHGNPIKHTIMLRQGKPRMARPKVKAPIKTEPKTVARKPVPRVVKKPVAKIAGGLVKTQRITGTALPSIKRKPAKTAVARHVEGRSSRSNTSYADEMVNRFGFRR